MFSKSKNKQDGQRGQKSPISHSILQGTVARQDTYKQHWDSTMAELQRSAQACVFRTWCKQAQTHINHHVSCGFDQPHHSPSATSLKSWLS